MTDHSIDELKRQYDAARSVASNATRLANDASERLISAQIAEMEDALAVRGIVEGVRVAVLQPRGGYVIGIFKGVRHTYCYGFRPHVAKMKKDGTAHATANEYVWGMDKLQLARDDNQHKDASQ